MHSAHTRPPNAALLPQGVAATVCMRRPARQTIPSGVSLPIYIPVTDVGTHPVQFLLRMFPGTVPQDRRASLITGRSCLPSSKSNRRPGRIHVKHVVRPRTPLPFDVARPAGSPGTRYQSASTSSCPSQKFPSSSAHTRYIPPIRVPPSLDLPGINLLLCSGDSTVVFRPGRSL